MHDKLIENETFTDYNIDAFADMCSDGTDTREEDYGD